MVRHTCHLRHGRQRPTVAHATPRSIRTRELHPRSVCPDARQRLCPRRWQKSKTQKKYFSMIYSRAHDCHERIMVYRTQHAKRHRIPRCRHGSGRSQRRRTREPQGHPHRKKRRVQHRHASRRIRYYQSRTV